MRRIGKFLAPGSACALLLAVGGGLLAAGAGSAKADTIIPLPGSVTYLTQTLPDTASGNSYLFIAGNGEIMVTNLAGKPVATLDTGDGISGLALSADGGTLYASVTSGTHAGSVAAITVSSIAGGTTQQIFYPLAAGETPASLAVQSGEVWVAYSTTAVDPVTSDTVTTWQIGAVNLAGGTFDAAAAAGSWPQANGLQLAADPKDTGVLVALAEESAPEAATYDTKTDPATPLAAQGPLGSGGNTCTYPGEIAVMPGGQQFAAACDGPGSVQVYSPANLATGVTSYNANGAGTSQAIAVAVDADGSVAVANRTAAYVYTPGGTLLNTFAITAGNKTDEAFGLEWVDIAGGAGLAAVSQSTATKAYAVQIFAKAKLLRPTVKFAATATTPFGKPVTLKGSSLLPGGAADTAKVTITRTGPGGTVALPAVMPSAGGTFTAADTPKAVGTYIYTATSGATSVTAKTTVIKDTPAISITIDGSEVVYKTVLHVTGGLGTTHGNRSLKIYAEVNGTGKNKIIANGKVNAKGQLTVAWTAQESTTFLVVFAGDADDASARVSAVVSVRARVQETLSGQYGTKKSGGTTYLLYHRTGKVAIAAAVTPAHPGECVKVQTQEFSEGAWHAGATTGCAKLSAASKVTVRLAVAAAKLGVPYRVRADYVSSSKSNASGASGWQYFMVEK